MLVEQLSTPAAMYNSLLHLQQQKKNVTDDNGNSSQCGVVGSSGNGAANEKKRVRRNAIQIERNYRCPVTKCEKRYG